MLEETQKVPKEIALFILSMLPDEDFVYHKHWNKNDLAYARMTFIVPVTKEINENLYHWNPWSRRGILECTAGRWKTVDPMTMVD